MHLEHACMLLRYSTDIHANDSNKHSPVCYTHCYLHCVLPFQLRKH